MSLWFLVFFLTPIVEMYLLIEVGGYIGALPTIGLVMLTAVIGVALLRIQGFATLTRGLSRLQQGQLPAQELAEGLLLAVAGAMLLTPGFVTDAAGFVLLFPPSRVSVARWLLSRVEVRAAEAGGKRGGFTIIEGDFRRHPDDAPRGDSGDNGKPPSLP
jgi:UPF0716 protein FxsA